jgi:porin
LGAPTGEFTGAWQARRRLTEQGVAPFANWTTEVWGNPAGGIHHHAWWDSLLDFGLVLDTARLQWWHGGTFMLQAHWAQSVQGEQCFEDYTGALNPVSSIMAGNHIRVFNLHYQHVWRDGEVLIKVGQLAADDDFMGSDYAGLFLNSAFGAMPSQVGTPLATECGNPPAFPIYSVAAPGILVRVEPVDGLFSQIGLYYGRPGFDDPENYGFDWMNEKPAELGLFWESGYSFRFCGRPATTRFGLSYHTGPLDDFSGQQEGVPPATRQDVPNFYLIQDVALLVDGKGSTRLGTFARGGFTPDHHLSMVSAYADAGVNWFAPLPSRTDDVFGVAISHTRFGTEFRKATGSDGVADSETTLEVTYKAQVTPWMALQADLQFLFDPAVNPQSGDRETATVLGLRAEIAF